MDTTAALKGLAGLAHENRLAIYRLLVEQGPAGMPAGQIAERLQLAAATTSFHLKELTAAGLALARPQSRFIFYSANYRAMNELIGYLTDNCCGGGDTRRAQCGPACAPASHTAVKPPVLSRRRSLAKSGKRRVA